MSFATILPMAFVMIAGPQIISSFFFATSDVLAHWSLAYVSGAAVSVTAFVTAAYFVGRGTKSAASSAHTGNVILDSVVLALLVVLILRVFLTRKTSAPPKWMGRLQQASLGFAFLLGLALLGVFPTDILTSVAAGLHVARHDDPWWHVLPFVGLTLLLLGVPALMVVALGRRAHTLLPKVRDWMNTNSWVVSEVVLVFFTAITINSLVSA